MAQAVPAGGATLVVSQQPSWLRVGQRIVIDPYSPSCELTRIYSISGSTVGLAHYLTNSHPANTTIYCPPSGVFDARWWGAADTRSGAQVPINAGLTEMERKWQRGTLYLPASEYRLGGSIVVPANLSIIGDPAQSGSTTVCSTLITCGSDFGAGQYMIRAQDITQTQNRFENLQLVGPHGWAGTGDTPAAMSGLQIGSSSVVRNCSITNVYAPIAAQGNHYTISDAALGGCRYGIYLEPPTAGGIGNCFVRNIQFVYVYACIGIAGNTSIDASVFEDLGSDHATWLMYKEAHTGPTGFIVNSYVTRYAGEGHGNGLYYDENIDAGHQSSFGVSTDILPSGISFGTLAYDPTKPRQVAKVQNGTTIRNAYAIQLPQTSPCFWQSNSGTLVLEQGALALFERLVTKGIPITPTGSDNFCISSSWSDGQGVEGVGGVFKMLAASGSAIAVGQLVCTRTRTDIDLYPAGGTAVPAGFALMPAAAVGDVIPVHTLGGEVPAVPCTGVVAAGNWLKPSATVAGKVTAAAGFADGPIVGVALSGGTNTNIIVKPLCGAN